MVGRWVGGITSEFGPSKHHIHTIGSRVDFSDHMTFITKTVLFCFPQIFGESVRNISSVFAPLFYWGTIKNGKMDCEVIIDDIVYGSFFVINKTLSQL